MTSIMVRRALLVSIVALGIVFGIVLGIAHWIAARKMIKSAAWLLPGNLMASFLASLVAMRASVSGFPVIFFFILYALFNGLIMGLLVNLGNKFVLVN